MFHAYIYYSEHDSGRSIRLKVKEVHWDDDTSSTSHSCGSDVDSYMEVEHQEVMVSCYNTIVVLCNSYITGTRDVWHLLHRSMRVQSARGLRAINAMHPECV